MFMYFSVFLYFSAIFYFYVCLCWHLTDTNYVLLFFLHLFGFFVYLSWKLCLLMFVCISCISLLHLFCCFFVCFCWKLIRWRIYTSVNIIGSYNGSASNRWQAIIWTNVSELLVEALTDFNEILTKIQQFSCNKMHLKMSFAKWWQYCFGH